MENIEKDNYATEKIPYTNELCDIFDKSIIEANGVFDKPNRELYVLTKVFNSKCKKILKSDSECERIMNLIEPITDRIKEKIVEIYENKYSKKEVKNIKEQPKELKQDDFYCDDEPDFTIDFL